MLGGRVLPADGGRASPQPLRVADGVPAQPPAGGLRWVAHWARGRIPAQRQGQGLPPALLSGPRVEPKRLGRGHAQPPRCEAVPA